MRSSRLPGTGFGQTGFLGRQRLNAGVGLLMKGSASRDRATVARARAWQEVQARQFAELSYSDLQQLPERQELASPPGLEEFRFAVSRTSGARGRVEINVFEYLSPEAVGQSTLVPFVRMLEARFGCWFEVTPRGKVVWPRFKHDPKD